MYLGIRYVNRPHAQPYVGAGTSYQHLSCLVFPQHLTPLSFQVPPTVLRALECELAEWSMNPSMLSRTPTQVPPTSTSGSLHYITVHYIHVSSGTSYQYFEHHVPVIDWREAESPIVTCVAASPVVLTPPSSPPPLHRYPLLEPPPVSLVPTPPSPPPVLPCSPGIDLPLHPAST